MQRLLLADCQQTYFKVISMPNACIASLATCAAVDLNLPSMRLEAVRLPNRPLPEPWRRLVWSGLPVAAQRMTFLFRDDHNPPRSKQIANLIVLSMHDRTSRC